MTSKNETSAAPGVPISHYVVLCLLSLAAVFFALLQQGYVLGNLLTIACGILGLIARFRVAPIVLLLLVTANQVIEGDLFSGMHFRSVYRPRWLDPGDLLLCVGVLGYLATHYRLQGIWYRVLTGDPRRPASSAPQRRHPEKMQPAEISLLLLSVPVWALLAQIEAAALAPSFRFFNLPSWLARVVLVVWTLGFGAFLVSGFLDVWKRRRMSKEAAMVFLQDVCWNELRGEERRLERWLAWKKVRDTEA